MLSCAGCKAQYVVARYQPGKEILCLGCEAILVLPSDHQPSRHGTKKAPRYRTNSGEIIFGETLKSEDSRKKKQTKRTRQRKRPRKEAVLLVGVLQHGQVPAVQVLFTPAEVFEQRCPAVEQERMLVDGDALAGAAPPFGERRGITEDLNSEIGSYFGGTVITGLGQRDALSGKVSRRCAASV